MRCIARGHLFQGRELAIRQRALALELRRQRIEERLVVKLTLAAQGRFGPLGDFFHHLQNRRSGRIGLHFLFLVQLELNLKRIKVFNLIGIFSEQRVEISHLTVTQALAHGNLITQRCDELLVVVGALAHLARLLVLDIGQHLDFTGGVAAYGFRLDQFQLRNERIRNLLDIAAAHLMQHLALALGKQLTFTHLFLKVHEGFMVVVGPTTRLHRFRPLGYIGKRIKTFRDKRRLGGFLGMINPLQQGWVKRLHHLRPLHLALFDVIKLGFHVRGKVHLEQIHLVVGLKLFLGFQNQRNQLLAQIGRNERTLFLYHILAFVEFRHDRRIGTRTPHSIFFQCPNERCFRVAGHRLGFLLLGKPVKHIESFTRRQRGQLIGFGIISFATLRLVGRSLDSAGFHVPREYDIGSRSPKQIGVFRTGFNFHGPARNLCRHHLAGHKPLPDQPVELLFCGFKLDALFAGLDGHVGRADGFMGFLRGTFAFVEVGFFRNIFRAVAVANKRTAFVQRRLGNVKRVGTHVGDKPAFIQFLRNPHRAGRRIAERAGGGLLQRTGDERRTGSPRHFLGDYIADFQRAAFELLLNAFELLHRFDGTRKQLAVLDPDRLAVDTSELDGKRIERSFLLADFRADGEIGFGLEAGNLVFAFNHQTQCHGLNATDTVGAPNLLTHHRTALETNEAVQNTTRLLSVDPVHIDFFRAVKRSQDGGLGNFVIRYPIEIFFRDGFFQRFKQMPGNGFPLAVGVGRKIDVLALLGFRLELLQHLLAARRTDIFRFERLLDIHTQLLGREIAYVAHRGHYRIILAQKLVNLFRLRRRLHNH